MAPIIIVALVLLAVYAGTKRLSGLQILLIVALTVVGILLVVFPNDEGRRIKDDPITLSAGITAAACHPQDQRSHEDAPAALSIRRHRHTSLPPTVSGS